MKKYCPSCYERPMLLFPEHTPDGVELICLAGHRFTAVPLKVLDIPEHELKQRNYGPKAQGQKL